MSLLQHLSDYYSIPYTDLANAMTHMFSVMMHSDTVLPSLIEDTKPFVLDPADRSSAPARAMKFFKLVFALRNDREACVRVIQQFLNDDTPVGRKTMAGIICNYANSFNLENIMQQADESEALREHEAEYLREMNVLRDFYKIQKFYDC
jgi:hypothetical protein